MGQKPVKHDFCQKWAQTLWEGEMDLSRPFWARFDQFYGYTGYQVPDRVGIGITELKYVVL